MIAWHYTTGEKFELIQQSGMLLPADIGVEPPELPIVWFSLAPYYENSARKGIPDESGQAYRAATVEEMYELGDGLYRFGCPISKLLTGERLRKAAKMSMIQWKRLLKMAQHMKATPGDWWGLPGGNLEITGLRIEKMGPDMKWRPLSV